MNRGLPVTVIMFLAVTTAFKAAGQVTTRPSGSNDSDTGGLEWILSQRPVLNQALTLDQAVEIALRESPVVRGAAEEVQAATGRLNAARAETRPWLSANTFASGGSNSNIIATPAITQPQMLMGLPRDAFFDQNLMLMFPLYTGGRLDAMVRQAAAMRSASQADLQTQRQDVALMTRMAYREVLARQSLVAVAQDRLQADQEHLRVDRNRFQQGAVAVLTVHRDEAEAAAAQQEVTNAQRDLDISHVQLKTVMGVSLASRLDLADTNGYQPSAEWLAKLIGSSGDIKSPSDGPAANRPAGRKTLGEYMPKGTRTTVQTLPSTLGMALPADLVALLRLAERQRPELKAAAERIRGTQADTAAARSTFLPQVNLFAIGDFMHSRSMNAFAGTTYGLVASLPIYNGGERHAHVQMAEAERTRQEQDRKRIGLQVVQEVEIALLNLRAAEQNIRTAQAAQTAAAEGYREALQRYEAGRSINLETLDALAVRTQAQSNVVQALYQYNVAQDQLLRAVGAL